MIDHQINVVGVICIVVILTWTQRLLNVPTKHSSHGIMSIPPVQRVFWCLCLGNRIRFILHIVSSVPVSVFLFSFCILYFQVLLIYVTFMKIT